ncbi:hypothetical protein QEN19_002726 [Hanseniaspora menglaensis]
MLFELITVVRTPKLLGHKRYQDAKTFCENLGKLILNNRGIIRKIENNGLLQFQDLKKKHGETFFEGYKVTMLYDCSPVVQTQVMNNLVKDPRVLSHTAFSHNEKLISKTSSTASDKVYGHLKQ